jgi:hypothetical protein
VAVVFPLIAVFVAAIGSMSSLATAAIVYRSRFEASLRRKSALMGAAAGLVAAAFVAHRPPWQSIAILAIAGAAAGLLAGATSWQNEH